MGSTTLPQGPHEAHALLYRYAELCAEKRAISDGSAENATLESAKAIAKELDTLKETFLKLQTLNTNGQKLNRKLSASWSKNTETVDRELLRKQMVALQLLSHDVDLPLELSIDLSKSCNAEMKSAMENGPKLYNEEAKPQTTEGPIKVPLEDYDTKAQMFGITPNKPSSDDEFVSVGKDEHEELVRLKVEARIDELNELPAALGSYNAGTVENDLNYSNSDIIDGVDDLKLDALIELMGLKSLPFQRQLRNTLLNKIASSMVYYDEKLNNNPVFKTWKRTFSVHPKQKVVQTARLAEKLLEQQRKDQEMLAESRQQEKIQKVVEFANEYQAEQADRQARRFQMGKLINTYHQQSEKDESKKLERNAKQRLQALKANDEEAYIKLLDQTKDKRITHLLKQTNSFLDSLANAVKVQQHESKVISQFEKGEAIEESVEEGADRREKIDYYEVAHQIKEPVTEQASILVGGKLKEYQVKGLEWMVSLYNNHLNGILADEMGLGKTIQSISLITYLIEKKKETGKFLVLVPLSTITNWTLEFEKWAPSVKTVVYKGSQQQRRDMQNQIRAGDFTVLLTTFEYVIRDRPMLAKFKWAHMLIDEGHRLKNTGSKLFQTLITYYHTRNRLILTGTPLQNNLPELWALLNFILPKVFNSVKSFDEWFNTPFANTGHQEKLEMSEEESLLVIRRLHKVLRPFLLRRLKKDVEKDLPDKIENVIKCKFSALQQRIYKQLLDHNALFIGSGAVGATKAGLKGLNNKVMQLRKACNHPFVFEEVETAVNPTKSTTDMIWRCSGKFELLDRVLPKFKATGHRVLIFFQMTQVMDIMEDYLRLKGMKYMRLDGSTKADDRQIMLKDFNAPDSEYFCFLLSTRAGGLGLNLQTADTVIIFDTDWNPHQDLQAQDRAHRIGQKNAVQILRLITTDSVEEVILDRAHQKLDIDGKVIQAGKFDNKSSAEEQEELLKRLLDADKERDDDEELDEYDDDDLNQILARSEEEKAVFKQVDEERKKQDAVLEGKPRLMDDAEVPEIFKEDMTVHLEQESFQNNGRRQKKKVFYDDGLTEEQWLDAMDAEDDTVEAAAARKRTRRTTNYSEDGHEGAVPDDDGDFGEDFDEEEEVPKKKNKKEPMPEWIARAYELMNILEALKDDEGNEVGTVFSKLPPRKEFADYYKIITRPVSISQLRRNLIPSNRKLKDFQEFETQLRQMFLNARIYNQEDSVVVKCADIVESAMEEKVKEWGLLTTEKLPVPAIPNEEPLKEDELAKMDLQLEDILNDS